MKRTVCKSNVTEVVDNEGCSVPVDIGLNYNFFGEILTYIIGLTEISIPMYILLTTVARIPSILMSTFGGDALGENKFMLALVAFVVTAIISGSGYLLYLFINSKSRQKSDEKNADRHE